MALVFIAVAPCICGDAAPQNGNGVEGGLAVARFLPPDICASCNPSRNLFSLSLALCTADAKSSARQLNRHVQSGQISAVLEVQIVVSVECHNG